MRLNAAQAAPFQAKPTRTSLPGLAAGLTRLRAMRPNYFRRRVRLRFAAVDVDLGWIMLGDQLLLHNPSFRSPDALVVDAV